jgi:hypothetical protein
VELAADPVRLPEVVAWLARRAARGAAAKLRVQVADPAVVRELVACQARLAGAVAQARSPLVVTQARSPQAALPAELPMAAMRGW